jgi:hypothetical protein
MKKIMIQQYMGVLATLATLVLSVTLYAYRSDQSKTDEKINTETIERKESDTELKQEIKETMLDHEKLHESDRNMLKQMQEDINIIKKHLLDKK